MYSQTHPYSRFHTTAHQSMRPPGPPIPPISIPASQQHQYSQYSVVASPVGSIQSRQQLTMPPSPSESSDRTASEEEYFNLPVPKPVCHVWAKYIWVLDVAQNPKRARMCGFGDKDRRPISPPPCIRLKILDELTKKEVNYETFSEVDLTHLVLTVDIWDIYFSREMNLVKQSNASPCISSAATGAYPTTASSAPPTHERPRPFDVSTIPGYAHHKYSSSALTSATNGGYYGTSNGAYAARSSYANGQNGQMSPYQNGSPAYAAQGYGYADPRYATTQSPTPQSMFNQQQLTPVGGANGMEHTYVHNPPPTTQLYTRNLIGSLCASAFRLRDQDDQWGIWFVLQDLSVRTEGWFTLKMNFFNIQRTVQRQMAEAVGGTTSQSNSLEDTAPCLAQIFSSPFKVYSAKKFPGVVESTPLSKAFANQGIKIPIRKDTGGKRGREDSDDGSGGED